jgi:Flp pilus assembly protein TadD
MNDFDADVCAGCGVPLLSYARVSAYSARLFNQGLAAARADRLAEARDLFAAVVYWSPLDVEARNALAMTCSALGDVTEARRHWEQVLCQRPNDPLAAAGLSLL